MHWFVEVQDKGSDNTGRNGLNESEDGKGELFQLREFGEHLAMHHITVRIDLDIDRGGG